MKFPEWITPGKWQGWVKYIITLFVFLVVYLFVGDQSVLRFVHRGREIRHLEEQRDRYLEGAAQAQKEIQMLQQPDSLERYAREQYYMHKDGEDIYLVQDE